MTYLPAYDANNGWDPHDGTAGAEPGVAPRTLFYLNDALGSAMGLIEKDGRVSSRYHYDEFGTPTDAKKFDVNWPGPDNLFGYTGLEYDYYSGLTNARARSYKPEIGRFISEDTYKGTLGNPQSQNGYSYVWNNPLIYTDPSGHKVWLIHGTYAKPDTWTPEFREYIGGVFDEPVEALYWSGGNSTGARSQAAEDLEKKIYDYYIEHPNEPIRPNWSQSWRQCIHNDS
jgi:RHS repeat-associated protein